MQRSIFDVIFKIIASILVASFIMTGCATIVSIINEPPGKISISSYPEQADLFITDEKGKQVFRGETPASVTLKTFGGYFRAKSYWVHLNKEGFNAQTVAVEKKLNKWYLGNIIIVSALGLLIIDPLTGDMWKLAPKDIHVPLSEKTLEAQEIDLYW